MSISIDRVECPLCKEHMVPTYIDIGTNREPVFILGLTCTCEGWLMLENDKSTLLAEQYGELEDE